MRKDHYGKRLTLSPINLHTDSKSISNHKKGAVAQTQDELKVKQVETATHIV